MVAYLGLMRKLRSSAVCRWACFVRIGLESESAETVCLNFDVFYGILEADNDFL